MIEYNGKLFWSRLEVHQNLTGIYINIPFQLYSKNDPLRDPLQNIIDFFNINPKFPTKISYPYIDLFKIENRDSVFCCLLKRISTAVIDRLMKEYEDWFRQTNDRIINSSDEINFRAISMVLDTNINRFQWVTFDLAPDMDDLLIPIFADSKKYPYANH